VLFTPHQSCTLTHSVSSPEPHHPPTT
jgi:hypothetical protein